MNSSLPIGVIGAGPKGLALAAKAAVLREIGYKVPDVVLIERCEAGAAWTGKIGFTDGLQLLGTPPEKDIGYPYHSKFRKKELNDHCSRIDASMQRFSWQAYLIAKNKFQKWLDRGRPAPAHQEWGSYLYWAKEQLSPNSGLSFITADVSKISVEREGWRIGTSEKSPADGILVRALVVTGPGAAKTGIEIDDSVRDQVLNGRTFWLRLYEFDRDDRAEITVIGSGETAGSVAAALTRLNTRVTIISKDPVVFSRSETFQENAVFSNPEEWQNFPIEFRKEFISRTDRGVFSQKVKADLDHCDRIGYEVGTVKLLNKDEAGTPQLVYEVGETIKKRPFDWVVIATGFDPLSFVKLFDEIARKRFLEAVGEARSEKVSDKINWNLAVEGCELPLHLPMLAGLAQGPGFPNLSCLGTLSDRILEPYLQI